MGLIVDFIHKIDGNRITGKKGTLSLQSGEKPVGASYPKTGKARPRLNSARSGSHEIPGLKHQPRHHSGDDKIGKVFLFRLQFFEQFPLCGDPI
jgi:hypothetical protein